MSFTYVPTPALVFASAYNYTPSPLVPKTLTAADIAALTSPSPFSFTTNAGGSFIGNQPTGAGGTRVDIGNQLFNFIGNQTTNGDQQLIDRGDRSRDQNRNDPNLGILNDINKSLGGVGGKIPNPLEEIKKQLGNFGSVVADALVKVGEHQLETLTKVWGPSVSKFELGFDTIAKSAVGVIGDAIRTVRLAPPTPGAHHSYDDLVETGVKLAGAIAVPLFAATLIDQLYPTKDPGVQRFVGQVLQSIQFQIFTGAVLGAVALAAVGEPAKQHINLALRPKLPDGKTAEEWFIKKEIDQSTYRFLLGVEGYNDQWIQHFENARFHEPTIREISLLTEGREPEAAWLMDKVTRLGFSPDDAKRVADGFLRRSLKTELTELRQEAVQAYVDGFMSVADLRSVLIQLGFRDQLIGYYLAFAVEKSIREGQKQQVGTLVTQFKKGLTDEKELMAGLLEVGMRAEVAQRTIQAARSSKSTKAEQSRLTQSQVLQAFRFKVLPEEQALDRLKILGLTPADAVLALQSEKTRTSIAEAKGIKTPKTLTPAALGTAYLHDLLNEQDFLEKLRGLKLSAEDARTVLALWKNKKDKKRAAPSETPTLSTSQIQAALRKGLISQEEATSRLAAAGWDDDDTLVLIGLAEEVAAA